jgi:hypothetical protein
MVDIARNESISCKCSGRTSKYLCERIHSIDVGVVSAGNLGIFAAYRSHAPRDSLPSEIAGQSGDRRRLTGMINHTLGRLNGATPDA